MIGWKLHVTAALAAILLGSVTLYVVSAEKAKAQVRVLEARLFNAENAARENAASFANCQKVNEANRLEASAQRERAIEAERRAAASAALADLGAREVERESQMYRESGLACPAITADFRKWVRGDS